MSPRSSSTIPLSSKIPATRVMWPRPSAGAVSWRAPRVDVHARRTWGRSSASAGCRSPAWETVTTRAAAPDWSLSSSGVPSAMTVPRSITTMLSASWSASSRYCVVSSRVVPSRDELAQHLPQLDPRARVEAGGRLVEEQHRRGRDQADREVEPPAHAAGVGLGDPVAGVGEREPLEQVVAGAPDVGRSRGRRGCRSGGGSPDRSAARRRWRPDRSDPCCGGPRRARSTTSWPATRPVPAVGRVRVVIIRTVVVLPAPLGPSRPSTEPSGTTKDDAVHGHRVAEVLDQVLGLDRENASWSPTLASRGPTAAPPTKPHLDFGACQPASPAVEIDGLVMRVRRQGGRRRAVARGGAGLDHRGARPQRRRARPPRWRPARATARAQRGTVRVLGLDPQRDRARPAPPDRRDAPGAAAPGAAYAPSRCWTTWPRCTPTRSTPPCSAERLGLADCGRTPYRRLSGGQQQRLGLAIALVGRPGAGVRRRADRGHGPPGRRTTWELLRGDPRRRRDRRADHPPHGRGRAPGRPHPHHRPRPADRHRDTGRADPRRPLGDDPAGRQPPVPRRRARSRCARSSARSPRSASSTTVSMLIHGPADSMTLGRVSRWCEEHDVLPADAHPGPAHPRGRLPRAHRTRGPMSDQR